MKPKNRLLLSPIIACASLANNASAVDGIKANNGTALNDPARWVSSTPPTSGTGKMIVNSTMSSNQTADLGDDLSVLGISSTGGGILTIGNTAGKALTITPPFFPPSGPAPPFQRPSPEKQIPSSPLKATASSNIERSRTRYEIR